MASKRYWVPSLFSTQTWKFEVRDSATWTFRTKQWQDDGFLESGLLYPPWSSDYPLGVSPAPNYQLKAFFVHLARSASRRDQIGDRHNIENLPVFHPFGFQRGGSSRLDVATVCNSSADGSPWLCIVPGTSNLASSDVVTPQFASATAWATLARAGVQAQLPAFLHRLEDTQRTALPWFVLEATGPQTPQLAFDTLNHVVREVHGTQRASLPFRGAVPTFRSEVPIEAFALTELQDRTSDGTRAWSWRLLRVVLGMQARHHWVTADLNWFQPYRDEGVATDFTGFSLRGQLVPYGKDGQPDPTDQFSYSWNPSQPDSLVRTVESMYARRDEKDVIAAVKLTNCSVVKRKDAKGTDRDNEWLRFGSIEIQPTGGAKTLEYVLRGRVGTGATAVYPQCKVIGIECNVRTAPGSDPVDVWTDRSEKPRESAPIVAVAGTIRAGTLSIESWHEPGQNATIDLRLTLPGDADPGSSLWINLRPFLVAKVGLPRTRDKETTLTWSSADAQGAQWRVEDPEIRLTLPPQAIGEEMERGNRFYAAGQTLSPINPAEPVRYRFSRPASLTLLPSPPEQRRRFEKSSINLRELLRGSIVSKMVVEMAYPLEVSYDAANTKRTILLTEVGEFLGQPAEVLPTDSNSPSLFERRGYLSAGMSSYAKYHSGADQAFQDGVNALARIQETAWWNFVSRVAELHVHDPTRPRGEMRLIEGVKSRLRNHRDAGAGPLANPLPVDSAFDPANGGPNFKKFLNGDAWARPGAGSLRGGLIHTFEFPSELLEVLETPEAVSTVIETLCLSALGSTGKMEAAFASGKTTFAIVAAHGQLSRLVKTRIGRIGALWNRAKHIVVYERTTSRSAQFKEQQGGTGAFDGWPILRKTEEYIEPIQLRRVFDDEEGADQNAAGFIFSCLFATQRIYVDGAWARDIGDGYEMPLWDERAAAADPKFYPRPQICVECHGEADKLVRLWFRQPDRLYFHSSTAPGTTVETDKWKARAGVDFEPFLPRLPVPTRDSSLSRLGRQIPANPDLCTAERFDLAVDAEGSVNLQHGRGKTPMLVTLQRLSIGRGSQTAPVPEMPPPLKRAQLTIEQTGKLIKSARAAPFAMQELRRQIEETIGKALFAQVSCADIERELTTLIHKHVGDLKDGLNPLSNVKLEDILQRGKDMWERASAELGAELLERGFLAEQVIELRAAEARKAVEELRVRMATWPQQLDAEQRKVLQGLAADIGLLANDVAERSTAFIDRTSEDIRYRLEQAAKACTAARQALPGAGPLAVRCLAAEKELSAATARLEGLPASSRKLLDPCRHWVANLGAALRATAAAADYVNTLDAAILQRIENALTDLTQGVELLATTFSGWVNDNLRKAAKDVADVLAKASSDLSTVIEAVSESDRKSDAEKALRDLDPLISTAATGITSLCRDARAKLQKLLAEVDKVITGLLLDAHGPVSKISAAVGKFAATAADVSGKVEAEMLNLVSAAAGNCKQLLEDLRLSTEKAMTWARQQADAAISEVLSSEAARQLEQYAVTAEKVWDVGSQAISLARAVGDLPKITPLEFDIDAADYVFDGKLPSIRMTPAVARLQQQGEKLLEALGVAMPCEELLDQLMPDIPAGAFDFSTIFPKFAGIDFSGLFDRFRLPKLSGNNLNITHGFDKATRRAWVNSTVKFAHPKYEELFGVGPVALGLEKMRFDAFTGVETRFDGLKPLPPSVKTTATLLGDWTLLGGGQRIVTFRELAIQYDGASGFHFDVSPDNIELHPSLKFISEFVQQFKEDLPPAIEIVEEEGRPVGVRAGTTVVLDDMPDLGVVTIGPIDMRSSLGLKLEQGRFLINSAFSLGNKQMPIFVQISWLGGGCWLETQATYVDGRVKPSISVGLSVGATRAFNLAGVAKGSFNVQLYCYINVLGSSSSVAIGLSMCGSALIVGFVNASVNLLLEAQHGGGQTTGTGRLDVSVKISWVYTFRYKTSVKHKF